MFLFCVTDTDDVNMQSALYVSIKGFSLCTSAAFYQLSEYQLSVVMAHTYFLKNHMKCHLLKMSAKINTFYYASVQNYVQKCVENLLKLTVSLTTIVVTRIAKN